MTGALLVDDRRGVLVARADRFQAAHPIVVEVVRFVLVGGLGTIVNAAVYLVLRTGWDVVPANLAALVVSTIVSTEANRRFTFGGAEMHRIRAHVQTLGAITFYAFYSSAVLVALHSVVPSATPLLETVTVAVASVLGGTIRFLLLRYWVLDRRPDDDRPPLRTWAGAVWWAHGDRIVHSALVLLAGTLLVLTT